MAFSSQQLLFSSQFSLLCPRTPPNRNLKAIPRAALREWKEYEDAVKRKDLARALRFLKSKETQTNNDSLADTVNGSFSNDSATRSGLGDLGLFDGLERDWEVLDTCLNADDMRLVSSAYGFLKNRGFLPSFGKFSNIVLEGPREVTPILLQSSTGLEVTKLSPKKWGATGISSLVFIAFTGGANFLVDRGIDIRVNLAAILGLAFLDSIFLGGACLAQISSYWPPNKRRILVHEAGHLLVAYLMGCPVRGVILDPMVAMQMGTQGQVPTVSLFLLLTLMIAITSALAGTQFWDEKLSNELAGGKLSGTSFDRYCMVLFAGIAAEALVYGEAEGGENDENLFRSTCVLLQPPLSVAQASLSPLYKICVSLC
ncbi:hypothetical protein NC653_025751 [Populus alba x Populus x berolinensis]|uniref:Uncharacterized protein n=1 Tax=Populus alba x Populus x berolinensis TaxID=444605 RepID=A0AAD6MCI3_9ROSI|nr:hypothetical protein NC653_025747 [Populus alba x Populus x berolinensis]KAJ6982741.1 hypothetical protein NC653_025751 [Populus alba x Populus x berolinensis]